MPESKPPPPFAEALRFWARFGWISFGGPTGQFALLHEELVVRRGWIAEMDFLQGINFCLMLPGPEVQQFVAYLGWRLHGTRGALAAGILFIIPVMLMLWGLSVVYVLAGTMPTIAAAFYGLGPPVLAVILRALFLLARRTLRSPFHISIAVAAAILMVVLHQNYPLIVVFAALTGALFDRRRIASSIPEADLAPTRPISLVRTVLICLAVWVAPLAAAWAVFGRKSIFVSEGLFFAKAAVVTFGGAYVALPYVTEHAVAGHQWITQPDMLHGIALASTLPGPLFIVVQFVAFVGAWHQPGGMPPLLAATLASALATWLTFAPSYLYIFAAGPFLQKLVHIQALQGAFRAISAAVVGVIIDFSVWYGNSVLFHAKSFARPDWFVLAVCVAALTLLIRFRISVPLLLLACAGLGVAWRSVFPAG